MGHQALKLIPGVNTKRTEALNEAGISTSNLIRFIREANSSTALVQKLGGWQKYFPSAIAPSVNALWPWIDTNSVKHLGVGASNGLYTIESGTYTNRSPQFYTINIAVSVDTTNNSENVFINDTNSNVLAADSVFIQTPISVGGIVLFGLYQCYIDTANRYRIIAKNILGAPIYATSTVAAGGAVPSYTTTSGSSTITVTLNNHGYTVGSNYAALVPVTVGGITVAAGNYTVDSVPTANTFTFAATSSASSAATVSMNGGLARITHYVGKQELPTAVGFGAGGFGVGGFGTGTAISSGRRFTTTSASSVGTTATIGFSGNCQIQVGSTITVAGVTPTGYNGTWIVTASTSNTVSFTTPTVLSGPQTVAGTVTVTTWGFTEVADWTLCNWGEIFVGSYETGEIFGWSPSGGGVSASILPNSPVANTGVFMAMPQRQLIAYGSTSNGIQDPLLIRYCDVNNYTSWVAGPSNQAGSYRLSTGSKIVGGIQGAQQSYLFTDIGVWSMQYIGFPNVYGYNEIGVGCGLIGKKAVTKLGSGVFWMGARQFWKVEGNGIQQINCDIRDMVFDQLDTAYPDKIRAGSNSLFNEVIWHYPTTGSGGVPTKYAKYNVEMDVWDYGDLTRVAWVDQSVLGPPIGADQNGLIYQHEMGYDADGVAMNPSFSTGYFAVAEGDVLSFIDQMWPDFKWGVEGGSQNASIKITFFIAEYPGQTPRQKGPFTVTEAKKFITPRFRSRLISMKIESDDVGSFWRLGNIRYRSQVDGKFL